MPKMKIIHVVHDFLFGGIESYLYYLVQAQSANPNLEVAILCCQEEDKVANPRMKTLGVKIYYEAIKPFEWRLSKYKRIQRIVNNYDFAQLHIYKPLLLEALSRSKTQVIFTVHTAGAVRREQSKYAKLKVKFQVSQLNRCCLGVVNNSKYSQDYWLEKGVKKKNNEVIYNGVLFKENFDRSLPFATFPQLKPAKFIIGTSSRFIGWKRVDYLIRAFAKFLEKGGDGTLLLVGDGDERSSLENLSKELKITDSVVFAGFQTEVTAYQSVMDVCVFPSVSEPFGLVAIECMHLGKPVLVMRDGGGLQELVEQVEPNFVVENVDALADKLLALSATKAIDSQASEQRVAFAEKFNIYQIESSYYAYYQSLHE